jgi:DNA-binding GntR family transcriptional regulator
VPGRAANGSRLPREWARKAIELLRDRGLVTTVTGRGTFVIAPAG